MLLQAVLSCQHLYTGCWFLWNIPLSTKGLPRNFKFVSSLDLLPRFSRLYISDYFCLHLLDFTISLPELFIRWQVCKSLETTFTLIEENTLEIFFPKTSFWMSAGTWFLSIVSLLLQKMLVIAFDSNCIEFLHCCYSVIFWEWIH